jgi:LysM repeat protein
MEMEDPMSAAVAWDVTAAPARMPVRPARPRLVSVPCGHELASRPVTPIRLTRAGRLAISLTAVAVMVVTAMALLPSPSTATVIDHSTTVRSGQTLSEVAAQQLPQLPIADAVARIQVANNLTTNQVHSGQALLIPAVG